MQQLLQYTPRLIFAVVLVIVGLLIAKLVHGIVAMAGDRGGLLHSATLARICYYVGVIITFVAAANHLGIAFRLLEQVSLIVLAGLTAGGALALGLGGQHVASELLAGYFVRMRFRPGDEVRLADLQGTVREVGAVSTVLETIDSDGLTHRRSVPNSKLLKEGLK